MTDDEAGLPAADDAVPEDGAPGDAALDDGAVGDGVVDGDAVGDGAVDGGAPGNGDDGTVADAGRAGEAAYGGLPGAILYAYRSSDSRLLRSYVLVGSLLTALVTLMFVQALVVLLGRSVGVTGGTVTFSRAFFVVVALAVVAPLLAPMVSTARRHRQGRADRRTDRTLGALGCLFVGALYLALVVSAPPELRESVDGPLAPVVEALYALPPPAAAIAPALVALAMWSIHRRAPA
jgi:hypothetical protein